MIDEKFKQLEAIGFTKQHGEGFEYYEYSLNGINFISSATDEPFKVYLETGSSYWTNVDDIKSMIQFINQAEVD